ncbi:hypothetical protein HRG84_24140 [Flavisolibacter sp. BT320]|nr:hypothetical protein [Flavisolibacter longurius]
MINSYPNPWDFSNKDKQMVSPDGEYRVEFVELSEIAMGAPVGGECFLIYSDNSKERLSEWAGGPVVWQMQGGKVAFPVWTRARDQRIAVADINARTLTIYSPIFRVLDLKSFDQGIITGHDSPIHMTTAIDFDTAKEKIEKVK